MTLYDRIMGNKIKVTSPPATAILAIPAIPTRVADVTSPPATAILAIPAILNPNQAEKQAKNRRIAEIAVAEKKPEQQDIFAPDFENGTVPANIRHTPLFCSDGNCDCSQRLPSADYPNGCGKCEYLNNPRQVKCTETIPAVFEQTGDPVSCPYWRQVCHAVRSYQDACTRRTDCPVFKFLKLNS